MTRPQRSRRIRPFAIAAATAATCACAVAVADGQVGVPSVPEVDAPPLQNLPQVPSTPSVPAPSVPSAPEVPDVPAPSAPQAPSVSVPSEVGQAPAVRVPSTDAPARAPGAGAPDGASLRGNAGSAARGAAGAVGSAGATADGAQPGVNGAKGTAKRVRPLTPKQRAVRRERTLRRTARELKGCLPALSGFERRVIVLRGGLNGRRPMSRAKTADRLEVAGARIRAAERSGLRRLRRADAEQGCGLQSGAGREAVARRLANGSVKTLSPLALAGDSPRLVSTRELPKDRVKVLSRRADSPPASEKGAASKPRKAGFDPTSSGDEGEGFPAIAWIAILAALMIAGVAFLLLRSWPRSYPYAEAESPSVYPFAYDATAAEAAIEEPEPEPASESAEPRTEAAASSPPEEPVAHGAGRRRIAQAAGGLAASGALLSLIFGRLVGRRRRR